MLFKFLHTDCPAFFQQLAEIDLSISADTEKHSFIASLEGKKIFSLRLPLFYTVYVVFTSVHLHLTQDFYPTYLTNEDVSLSSN